MSLLSAGMLSMLCVLCPGLVQKHMFDGYGMLSKFAIDGKGNTVTVSHRCVPLRACMQPASTAFCQSPGSWRIATRQLTAPAAAAAAACLPCLAAVWRPRRGNTMRAPARCAGASLPLVGFLPVSHHMEVACGVFVHSMSCAHVQT